MNTTKYVYPIKSGNLFYPDEFKYCFAYGTLIHSIAESISI